VRLATLIAVGMLAASHEAPRLARVVETHVVAPLPDPAMVPGVGRCTSDGACTVTDAAGTRRATALRPAAPARSTR
jgi:hypothetical protein